jgi:hypothetical protein
MSRARLLVILLAITAVVVVAVLLATGALSGARKADALSGSSPSCLPSTLNHSATLEGLAVNVSPAPETDTANPYTQISFLGVPATEIHEISVVGQRSGNHWRELPTRCPIRRR